MSASESRKRKTSPDSERAGGVAEFCEKLAIHAVSHQQEGKAVDKASLIAELLAGDCAGRVATSIKYAFTGASEYLFCSSFKALRKQLQSWLEEKKMDQFGAARDWKTKGPSIRPLFVVAQPVL